MRLTTLSLPDACRTATHALAREVLAASLREATRYDRAVGFFSSTVFTAAPEAFEVFFARQGSMRLVCSPVVGAADLAAIHRALVEPKKALADAARAGEFARGGDGARAFAAWLARGSIGLQIAIPKSSRGLYHEKIGLFVDTEGNRLAIAGSANESLTAWSLNFERIDVFSSWEGENARRRCWHIEQAFNDLWRNATSGVTVLDLQEAYLGGHLQARPVASLPDGDVPRGLPQVVGLRPPEILAPPSGLRLLPHQERAIARWAEQGGRGILAMATGVGKTFTALVLAARLSANFDRLAIVIVAPFIHLVDQWIDNARRFGLRPVRAAESRRAWEHDLAVAVNAVNAGQRPVLSVVVTQATLTSSSRFGELLAALRAPLLIVGDEAHNYGTADVISALPQGARFRLGLSATPERHGDPEGTARLFGYFGPVAERYGLGDAIRDEVLTPYRYFPVRVELEPDELDRYLAISKQLARYMTKDDEDPGSDLAMRLLLKRARIVASARQKLPKLAEILDARRREDHILVYCGDGQVEGEVPEEQQRQVEAAVALLGNDLGMRCASYTAMTPPDRRRELLRMFADGQVQVLVAIRCLDEGVDVPSTQTAIILASSTNPRQFVQRRGRILRRATGKLRADLYDFIVCPDLDALVPGSPEYRVVQGMLRREFQRAAEFAGLALNGPVARRQLMEITERLGLYDGWYTPAPPDEQERR